MPWARQRMWRPFWRHPRPERVTQWSNKNIRKGLIMFDLSGKSALITGASGGIGGAVARALHAAGAQVALSGTREAPLRALALQPAAQ